jgi:hypothetical protein
VNDGGRFSASAGRSPAEPHPALGIPAGLPAWRAEFRCSRGQAEQDQRQMVHQVDGELLAEPCAQG